MEQDMGTCDWKTVTTRLRIGIEVQLKKNRGPTPPSGTANVESEKNLETNKKTLERSQWRCLNETCHIKTLNLSH